MRGIQRAQSSNCQPFMTNQRPEDLGVVSIKLHRIGNSSGDVARPRYKFGSTTVTNGT